MKRNEVTQSSTETITRTVELMHKYVTRANETKVMIYAVTLSIDLEKLLTDAYGVGEKAITNATHKSREAGGAITAKAQRIKEYTEPRHVN